MLGSGDNNRNQLSNGGGRRMGTTAPAYAIPLTLVLSTSEPGLFRTLGYLGFAQS